MNVSMQKQSNIVPPGTSTQLHNHTGIAVEEQITIQCYCCTEMATEHQRVLEEKGWGFYETFYLCPIHETQVDQ